MKIFSRGLAFYLSVIFVFFSLSACNIGDDNNSLQLASISDQQVDIGTTKQLQLSALNTNGKTVTFSASPLPLPANASLDAQSGMFTFSPDTSQAGELTMMFTVADGESSASEEVRITVPAIDPAAATGLRGRVLDANSSSQGQTVPVVGAVITLLNSSLSAVTDQDGYFQIDNIAEVEEILDINTGNANPSSDGSPYAGFREKYTLQENVLNVEARPFYIPRLFIPSMVTVVPSQTTVVTNDEIGVILSVPPNTAKNPDGTDFTGQLSISEVPPELAPAPLPDFMQPGLLITIQPVGVTFSTPVPITFPNTDNLPPGSETDIWSLDPDTGEFTIVGVGQVSADGQYVETISGGIVAADWHLSVPPRPDGVGFTPGVSICGVNICCDTITTSKDGTTAQSRSGCTNTTVSLPSYYSLGQERELALSYSSGSAYPQVIFPFEMTIPVRAAVPPTISYRSSIGGIGSANETYVNTSSLDESRDETLRAASSFLANDLSSGIYPYSIELNSNYEASTMSAELSGNVVIINEQKSPFGAGWALEGTSRLYKQYNGSRVLYTEPGSKSVSYSLQGADNPSMYFDGNDYLINRSLPILNAHSMEFWLRIDDVPQPDNSGILGIGPTAGACGLGSLFRTRSDGGIRFHVDPSGCGGRGSGLLSTPPLGGVWSHIAGTYDGSRMRLYVNGELVGETTARYTPSTNFVIGTDAFGFRRSYVRGSIDEARVWNRELTQEEIQSRMNDVLTGTEDGLVLYWPMDEGTGPTVFDGSGNGLNANLGADNIAPEWLAQGPGLDCEDRSCLYVAGDGDYTTLLERDDGGLDRILVKGGIQTYDASGLLTATSDRNGNSTVYGYDAAGNLVRITDPASKTTNLGYVNGLLANIVDPAGRTTSFEHNASGDLVKVVFPDGTFKSFDYDSRHLMTSETDERGKTTTQAFDLSGAYVSSVWPDGSTRQLQNVLTPGLVNPGAVGTEQNPAPVTRPSDVVGSNTDGNGNQVLLDTDENGFEIQSTDANGNVTLTERDDDGNPVKTTRPDGSIIERTFDENGNLLSSREVSINAITSYTYDPELNLLTGITDPLGNVTTLIRDSQGNVVIRQNALGQQTDYVYNAQGQVTQIIDQNGLVTDIVYDAAGQPVTMTASPQGGASRVTAYSYNAVGLISSIKTPDGISLALAYDMRGRLVMITDNLGQKIINQYDDAGNLVRYDTTEADGTLVLTFQQAFDDLDRLTETRQPHDTVTDAVSALGYDNNGNQTTQQDPNSNTVTSTYDPGNRLQNITDALGGVTEYIYDSNDRLISVKSPNGSETLYTYDSLGRILTETSSDRGTLTYTYDLNDNIISITDARGITANYSYDALNRVTAITYPDTAEKVALTYDNCVLGVGRLCSVSDQSGTESYEYDAFGNIVLRTAVIQGATYITSFVYDAGDRLVQVTYPNGRTVQYGRDTLRRINSVTTTVNGASVKVLDSIAYRADQRLLSQTFGNGLVDTRSYDLQGRLQDQVLGSVDTREYVYDLKGNLIQLDDDARMSQYVYDELDRLVQDALFGTPVTNFVYDPNSNRLSQNQGTVTNSYIYNANSNVLANIDSATIGRDASGNRVSDRNGARTLTYNNASRLYQVLENGQVVATYTYNALGQRTSKVTTQATTTYHYDLEGRLISETNAAGNAQRDYVYIDGVPVAQIGNDGTGENVLYLHSDHLGTPRNATDASGSVVWSWESGSFGSIAANNDPEGNGQISEVNLRFPGQYYDAETDLHYNYFRYYDPQTGRYITSDPIGLRGGLNTYGYVGGNPSNFIDPSGLAALLGNYGAYAGNGSATTGVTIPGWAKKPPNPALLILFSGAVGQGSDIVPSSPMISNGWDDKFPGLILPPGVGDIIDPWSDTSASTRQDPKMCRQNDPDECQRQLNADLLECEVTKKGISKLACRLRAQIRFLTCKGDDPDWPDDDFTGLGGNNDLPNLIGF